MTPTIQAGSSDHGGLEGPQRWILFLPLAPELQRCAGFQIASSTLHSLQIPAQGRNSFLL